jgi:superfamily I DNA/RNA helicase
MLEDLNPDQKKAVITTDSNLLVSACPGAGKTRLLQEKASYILDKEEGTKILTLTFTKDAAEEIYSRIETAVGKTKAKRVIPGTFHSLAQKQLKAAGRRFTIINPSARFQLLQRLHFRYGGTESFDTIVEGVEFYKSKILNYKNLPNNPIVTVLIRYQEELKKYNKLDFDDLLLEAVKGMQDKTIKPYDVDYMFVDEFQDLDEIQYEWIRCHKATTKITAVGDEDQSIYAFRAALGYKGMLNFEHDFDAKKVLLGLNYRCRAEILSAGDKLIKNNLDRNLKDLIANKGVGGSVNYRHFTNQEYEVNALVDAVGADKDGFGDWAVLTRTNKMMDKIEGTLCVYNIPYKRYGGKSIWSNHAVEIFVSFLMELENKNGVFNTINFLSWAGVGDEDIGKITHKLGSNGVNLWNDGDIHLDLLGKGKKVYDSFSKDIKVWNRLISKKRYEMAISLVFNWMLHNNATKVEQMVLEIACNALNRLIKVSIRKRIDLLNPKNNKKLKKENKVQLYTLHKSKGLEFKNVWMPFVDEGSLPHEDSSIGEERRLTYVGMTRAEERLHISSSKTPSRFISEADLK